MGRPSKHSPELRERAIRMVFDHTPEHPSQWAAIRSVGEKLGIRTESLRRWVRQAERDTDHDPLFEAHRWTANLRILEIDAIKTVPHVPLSHPFVEALFMKRLVKLPCRSREHRSIRTHFE